MADSDLRYFGEDARAIISRKCSNDFCNLYSNILIVLISNSMIINIYSDIVVLLFIICTI